MCETCVLKSCCNDGRFWRVLGHALQCWVNADHVTVLEQRALDDAARERDRLGILGVEAVSVVAARTL